MDLIGASQFLLPDERMIVSPFEEVAPSIADFDVREQTDSVVVSVTSPTGRHCSLELVFGRADFGKRLSIFVGRGAEFCNAEEYATHGQAVELANDVRDLLTSVMRSDQLVDARGLLKETYTIRFRNRKAIRLTYRGRADVGALAGTRSLEYQAWVSLKK